MPRLTYPNHHPLKACFLLPTSSTPLTCPPINTHHVSGNVLVFLAFALVLLFPQSGYSQSNESIQQEFKLAQNAYTYGNYADAIQRFIQLLYPKPGKLRSKALRREAHKYLGISYYYVAKRTQNKTYLKRARQEFLSYLLLKLDARFDPLLYPPDLVAFFDKIRRINARRLANLRKRKRKRPSHKVQVVPIRLEYQTRVQSPLVAMLPFGIPQFINGHHLKGSLLLAGEAITLGLNIGAYFQVSAYQIKDGDQQGRFKQDDIPVVKRWQVTQFVSIALFAGMLVYGFVDGFLNFKRVRKSIIPTEIPRLDPKKFSVPLGPPNFSISAR